MNNIHEIIGNNVQCSQNLKGKALGTSRCGGLPGWDQPGHQQWFLNGWEGGEICQRKCMEVIKESGVEGCCEARPRSYDFQHSNPQVNTYCIFRKFVGIIGGYSDSKAVTCKKVA